MNPVRLTRINPVAKIMMQCSRMWMSLGWLSLRSRDLTPASGPGLGSVPPGVGRSIGRASLGSHRSPQSPQSAEIPVEISVGLAQVRQGLIIGLGGLVLATLGAIAVPERARSQVYCDQYCSGDAIYGGPVQGVPGRSSRTAPYASPYLPPTIEPDLTPPNYYPPSYYNPSVYDTYYRNNAYGGRGTNYYTPSYPIVGPYNPYPVNRRGYLVPSQPSQPAMIVVPAALADEWHSWMSQAMAAEQVGHYSEAAALYGRAWQTASRADRETDRACLQAEASAHAEAARAAQAYLSRAGRTTAALRESDRRRQRAYDQTIDRLLGPNGTQRCSS